MSTTVTAATETERYTKCMVRSELRLVLYRRALDEGRNQYSVREVARGADLAASVVQGLMNNKFKRIDKETINKICNYLKLPPCEWLVWKPEGE